MKPNRELLAPGAFGRAWRLRERIEMLLERGRDFSPRVSGARVAMSVLVLLGCVIAGALAPRLIAFAQQRPQFEVASIRPNPEHALDMGNGQKLIGKRGHSPTPPANLRGISGNRFTEEVATLSDLIIDAYYVRPFQIAGGPRWAALDGDAFNITAKAVGEGTPTSDQVRLMLQTLLADRFHLKLHRETKEVPVYDLVIGKGGPKMKQVPAGADGQQPRDATQMATIAAMVANFLDRPLVDKTGLTGFYRNKWDQNELLQQLRLLPGATGLVPSVFTAVKDQLGLELKATKSPFEILVIDHAEKPDGN